MHDGDWLNSGDLRTWADGEIYITGRAKDIIIKAGEICIPTKWSKIVGRVREFEQAAWWRLGPLTSGAERSGW